MPKRKLPRPTEGELAILRVLWRRGLATVREVYTELDPARETGYTNVLKLMQIMAEKGLVARDESQRTHVYTAALTATAAQRQFVGHLLDRLFNGSAKDLVVQALSARKTSKQELAEIRRLLDDIERDSQ
jgi:predicted transcriptional regulator